MVRKPELVVVDNLRGGEGPIEIYHILSKDELRGHGKMFAKIVIKPHCSIGYHQHESDAEPLYIVSGDGIFTDDDGNEIKVGKGDVCTMNVGEKHGIRNASETEDLVLIAFVMNK